VGLAAGKSTWHTTVQSLATAVCSKHYQSYGCQGPLYCAGPCHIMPAVSAGSQARTHRTKGNRSTCRASKSNRHSRSGSGTRSSQRQWLWTKVWGRTAGRHGCGRTLGSQHTAHTLSCSLRNAEVEANQRRTGPVGECDLDVELQCKIDDYAVWRCSSRSTGTDISHHGACIMHWVLLANKRGISFQIVSSLRIWEASGLQTGT
jgi:hypothetical protein